MSSPRKVLVWDLPTRLFHWLLVVLVITAYVSVKIGGNAMRLHMLSGYAVLALLLFRLVWGFIGGWHARFSSFISGPRAIIAYLGQMMKKDGKKHLGHNPLGGWSVVFMLIALLVQTGTGLFANDEIATTGPLADRVAESTSLLLTRIHRINEWVIIALVATHFAAILFYFFYKKDNLVRPMIWGTKIWDEDARDGHASSIKAAVILAAAATAVYFGIR